MSRPFKRPWRGGEGYRGRYNRGWNNRRPRRGIPSISRGRGWATNELIPSQESDSVLADDAGRHLLSQAESRDLNHNTQSGPYSGWKLYIQNEPYTLYSPLIVKLKVLEDYFKRKELCNQPYEVEKHSSFVIDYKNLTEDVEILSKWPEIATDIHKDPETCLNLFGLALHQLLVEELKREDQLRAESLNEPPTDYTGINPVPKVLARVTNFFPNLPLKNMKSSTFGKFVSVKGTVIKVSNVKPLCTIMTFLCGKCGKTFVRSQPYGKYTLPLKCIVRACRGQHFTPLYDSPMTETVDWQSVRLQEISREDHEAGRMPRSVECELMYDLVDSCVPGDTVAICGVVKVTSSEVQGQKSSKDKCTFVLYVLGNSVVNLKGGGCDRTSLSAGLELTLADAYAVEAIQAEENLFQLLVASLCPAIYGHEMVKAGLLLGLFGGTRIQTDRDEAVPIRGDPHILVVGDPGLGKSQMLQACSNVAPRAVYVCGNTTTSAGLTVTMTREGGGDFTLEAGALVLGDQGCCCIDEFDKMSVQHNSLLEAMEQQTISVAKAGLLCSLPARTSILAAANPTGGHYDKSRTVSENLRMGSALLSRFDLVFILLDKPDAELDCKLSEHVIAMHSGRKRKGLDVSLVSAKTLDVCLTSQDPLEPNQEQPLKERLKNNNREPISHPVLRKYIAYARKYVHPKISIGAAKILQKFYLELRKRTKDSIPITTRQLESLIRLTQARTKMELREECTEQDAMEVVEIMKHSMVDVWSDSSGLLDVTRSQHGSGMSGRPAAKKFIAALTRMSETSYNSLFSVDQMKEIVREMGLNIPSFGNFLDSLNIQGYLLKKGPKIYKLLTTDY